MTSPIAVRNNIALSYVLYAGSSKAAITGTGLSKLSIEGNEVALHGDAVAPHGIGVHENATLIATTTKLVVGGKAVVRHGDLASCGHSVVSVVTKVGPI